MNNNIDTTINLLLSTFKPYDIDNMYIQIKNLIDTNINYKIDPQVFWNALLYRCPIQIITLLYNNNKNSVLFSYGEDKLISSSQTRILDNISYDFEFFLSRYFGDHFRHMLDDEIEYIEYILKCLELFGINESDIDWDLCLKSGYIY